jgi:hypothetical protein
MGVIIGVAIALYVLGMVPTYEVFDKTTTQSKTNKIGLTVFWPTVAILQGITYIIQLFKKK